MARMTAAERQARAAEKARADALALVQSRTRALQMRTVGYQHPDIAETVGLDENAAASLIGEALDARLATLETAIRAQALEAERLDALERRAQAVLLAAANAGEHWLVLRAVDRLLLISERRSTLAPERPSGGELEAAVRGHVDLYPVKLRTHPAAAVALLLARRMDAGMAAADLTGIVRELRASLAVLADIAPPEAEDSAVDELRERRAKRLASEQAQ